MNTWINMLDMDINTRNFFLHPSHWFVWSKFYQNRIIYYEQLQYIYYITDWMQKYMNSNKQYAMLCNFFNVEYKLLICVLFNVNNSSLITIECFHHLTTLHSYYAISHIIKIVFATIAQTWSYLQRNFPHPPIMRDQIRISFPKCIVLVRNREAPNSSQQFRVHIYCILFEKHSDGGPHNTSFR